MGRDPSTTGTEQREGDDSTHHFCLLQTHCPLLMGKNCQTQCKTGETHSERALRRPQAAARRGEDGEGGSSAGGNQGTDVTTLWKGHRHSGSRHQQVPSCRRAGAHPRADKRREMPHRVRLAVAASHVPWARQNPNTDSSYPGAGARSARDAHCNLPRDAACTESARTPPGEQDSPALALAQPPTAATCPAPRREGPRARQRPGGDHSKGIWL